MSVRLIRKPIIHIIQEASKNGTIIFKMEVVSVRLSQQASLSKIENLFSEIFTSIGRLLKYTPEDPPPNRGNYEILRKTVDIKAFRMQLMIIDSNIKKASNTTLKSIILRNCDKNTFLAREYIPCLRETSVSCVRCNTR